MEEAHILRGLLQAEDIMVFLSDINRYEGDIPIPLHVPLQQKEEAQKVVDLFYENMKPLCPKCKSSRLKTDYRGFFKDFFKRNCTKEYKCCERCNYCW